jgi:phosphate transport system substrate-binding protein
MGLKYFSVLFVCLLILSGCRHGRPENKSASSQDQQQKVVSGNISISGAYALAPLARKWAENFMKLNPGVRIEIVESGTGSGLDALIEKRVQLAMISRPLAEEEREAGILVIPVAKDGIAPIVNGSNPYLEILFKQGLSTDEFQKAFTSDKPVTWGDLLGTNAKDKVMVFSRADESGASDLLAKFLFRSSADFNGIKVTGDNEMIRNIQANPLALGFCNFSYAFSGPNGERTDNIQVIPFDLDFDNNVGRKEIPFKNLEEAHRSVWLGIYPDMLCRELTFGSLGKPSDPAVIEFLRYVLTEGQEDVSNSGLCKLNNVYLRYSLDFLE